MILDVDQAYGNCPQYIHRRDITVGDEPPEPGPHSPVRRKTIAGR